MQVRRFSLHYRRRYSILSKALANNQRINHRKRIDIPTYLNTFYLVILLRLWAAIGFGDSQSIL